MKSLSSLKLGAALCASSLLIPVSFAQSTTPQPGQEPAETYPSRSSDSIQQQAREQDSVREGSAQSVRNSALASAKQQLQAATFADRKRVVDSLEDIINASQEEEDNLKDAADKLSGTTRDNFDAAAKVAETRREALEESCDELNDAKQQEWDVRKRQASNDLDLYSQAMDRVRAAVGMSQVTPARAQP